MRPGRQLALAGAWVAGLLCLPLAWALPSTVSGDSRTRPGVILLMSDDQGWGDAGYQGHPTLETPALDLMAREGVVFDRFYSAAPVCSPTRGSCLTGRHPARYGITGANTGHLPPEEVNLAQVLGEAGYTTGMFGKWHLGTLTTKVEDANRGGPRGAAHFAPPWDRGFDVSFVTESKVPTWNPLVVPAEGLGHRAGAGKKEAGEPYGTRYWTGLDAAVEEGLEGDDSEVIMDRAIEFIDDALEGERPFLAVIWFHAPHLPAIAGGEDLARYPELSPEERHYNGCITAMDRQVGRLREHLEQRGAAGDTLLFFCSDNGPENRTPGSAGGLRERKRSLREGGIRVPGIAVWPGRLRPRRLSVPASTSDYLPTICDLLGLSCPDDLDGRSLRPWLEGGAGSRPQGIGFTSGRQRAWVTDRFKLYSSDEGRVFKLHDLVEDPGEEVDLTSTQPELAARLRSDFEAWYAGLEPGED